MPPFFASDSVSRVSHPVARFFADDAGVEGQPIAGLDAQERSRTRRGHD
jgi:hypothetical protein